MNGELAQVAALTAHAKVALASHDPSAFLTLQNSTFKFVNATTFERERHRLFAAPRIVSVGSAPLDWLRHLERAGVREVDLAVWPAVGALPAHIAASFSGGGTWGIRTAGRGKVALWRGRWAPDRQDDPNRRIWSVVYREFPGEDPPVPASSIDEAAERLRISLGQAEQLAREADLSMWPPWFGEALRRLDASPVAFDHHADLLPPSGYTEPARRLLSACEKAWVFGGMGWWNDIAFEDRDLDARYRAVTPELYSAVLLGTAAAVNSFRAAAPREPANEPLR